MPAGNRRSAGWSVRRTHRRAHPDRWVRDDTDPDVREEALEALADLADGAGVPALLETARSHPDRRMRVKAIELLGDSDDPRALEALRNLIRP